MLSERRRFLLLITMPQLQSGNMTLQKRNDKIALRQQCLTVSVCHHNRNALNFTIVGPSAPANKSWFWLGWERFIDLLSAQSKPITRTSKTGYIWGSARFPVFYTVWGETGVCPREIIHLKRLSKFRQSAMPWLESDFTIISSGWDELVAKLKQPHTARDILNINLEQVGFSN